MIYPPFDHWIWLIPAFLIGACIGSFLNVVIYRVPLGMSVNKPNRSFCPNCRKPIPVWLNLPLISWLWLRGKCAECKVSISFRYFGVELLTAVLFTLVWWLFPVEVVLFLWVLMALLVAITFIDIEHMVIPTGLTWAGTVAGLLAAIVYPRLPGMAGYGGSRLDGLISSGIGFAAGFFGLWAVVNLGKMAFGKKEMHFDQQEPWRLEEPESEHEPLWFIVGDERIAWWDLFNRKGDQLIIDSPEVRIDGEVVDGGRLVIRGDDIELPDGSVRRIEDVRSLDGQCLSVVIPREAMGFGDVHLMGMIGAFFGWTSLLFTLFAASMLAIAAAVLGRVGLGKPLPFGPFLALGALAWAFGGWKFWQWYMSWYLGTGWIE